MKLRNISFRKAIGASGIQGFFSGSEYFYHKYFLKYLPGFSLDNMTFVAKTMTLEPKSGNVSLEKDGVTLSDIFPSCIIPYFTEGMALNAVGLSNIGAKGLLEKNIWQEKREPFMLSFATTKKTKEDRLSEIRRFVDIFKVKLPWFKTGIALQINFSCPNVSYGQDCILEEIILSLDIASELNIPIIPKFNVLVSHESSLLISKHSFCDAICISNTIPYGELPERIPWESLFGSRESPLKEFGGGGLSGTPLFPLLREWIEGAQKIGIEKPIIAGGGIMNEHHVEVLSRNPIVKAISLGSVAFLRPWRLKSIIEAANHYID